MKVVLASRHLPDAEVDMVLVENVRGARMAVEHLVAHGHTRIAYVGGPESIAQFQDRAQGWREALEIAGLAAPSELYLALDKMDIEAGFSATQGLMGLGNPPTAIFAATDNLAFGVLKACSHLSYSVPDRIAVVGFDNVPFGEISLVPLTSVDGSGFNIGQRALRLLADRIENDSAPAAYSPIRMVIQPNLCIRQSCGCNTRSV
jgi:LacI family transcriptional regulator